MPRIPESDAYVLASRFNELTDEQRPLALDLLTRYRDQQRDLGESQWPSIDQQEYEARQKLRQTFTSGLDAVPADISPFSDNPRRDKAIHANLPFLATRYGKTGQEIADRYEFFRNDYAARNFGQFKDVTDEGFYSAVAGEIQGEITDEKTLMDGRKAALRGEEGSKALMAYQAANVGDWKKMLKGSRLFTQGYLDGQELIGENLPLADELMQLLETRETVTGEKTKPGLYDDKAAARLDEIMGNLGEMTKGERKRVYASLEARAEAAGYDPKGFWSQMLSNLDRGLARAGDTVGDFYLNAAEGQMGQDQAITSSILSAVGAGGLAETFKTASQQSAENVTRRQNIGNIHDELADIVAGKIDPLRTYFDRDSLMGKLEGGAIKAPGAVVPFMAASAAFGPWGGAVLFTPDFAEQNRRDLERAGVPRQQAIGIGAAAAPAQAAVESLSNMLQLGKFPAATAFLSKFTKPVGGSSLIGRYLQNSALSLGTEFTEEQLQDNVFLPLAQNFAAAIDKDVPTVGMGQIWENIKTSSPDLFFTLAPMALVFGGVMTSVDANLSEQMTSNIDGLRSLGFSQAQATTIAQEPTADAKVTKARELWGARAGTKETMEGAAKSLSERLRMFQTDAVAAQQELERRGAIPILRPSNDGSWTAIYSDGSYAQFENFEQANAAKWSWWEDQLGKAHQLTRDTLTNLDRSTEVGREYAVEISPDARTAARAVGDDQAARARIMRRIEQGKTLGDLDPDEGYTNAIAIDKLQSATAGEDPLAAISILGSSRTAFKDGILRTTIRLYEGANVLTLVEEKLEGDAQTMLMKNGGRDWLLSRLRSYEAESGDKLFRKVGDDKLEESDLVEAFSHVAQSYLVGRSTRGPALQSKAQRRFGRLLMKSGLSGALNAEATFFAAVASRAQKINKLKEEGKFPEDLAEELEKQLGIDSTAKHEEEALKEADAIANEVKYAGGESYSEENPGPNGETFSIRLAVPDPAKAAEFEAFGLRALAEPDFVADFTYRNVTDVEADEIVRQGGPDMRGLAHSMEANRLRHAFKSHSDPSVEAKFGQRVLEKSDLPRFLEALDNPDSITVVPGGRNNTKVMYQKAFSDGTLLVSERTLETSSRQTPRMNFKTAFVKVPPAGVKPNTSPVYTPGRQGQNPPTAGQSQETNAITKGKFETRVAAMFSPFQKSPELRMKVAEVAKERALRLGAEWIDKAAVIRSASSINKERNVREALAYDKRLNDYLDTLTPSARQALEWEPSALNDDPLVSAMLDHGKLMSRSTALRQDKLNLKQGDYDGAPWLPAAWYSKGAGIMPDQMAQALHDAGLLPDAYPDTLWNELGKRVEASRKDKALYRESQAAYKAATKQAREESRAEAEKWAEKARKDAGSPASHRASLKAAFRTLDGILAAAPAEVRAKVGGYHYVKMAGQATDESRLKELEKAITSLNEELEKWLVEKGREQLEGIFKAAHPKGGEGQKSAGKLGPENHAWFMLAEQAARMSPAESAKTVKDAEASLSEEITKETLAELSAWLGRPVTDLDEARDLQNEQLTIYETFGSALYGPQSPLNAAEISEALETARDRFVRNRVAWFEELAQRRERRQRERNQSINQAGGPNSDNKRRAQQRKGVTLQGVERAVLDYFDGGLDPSGFLKDLLGESSIYQTARRSIITAGNAKQDALRTRRAEYAAMLKNVFGKGTRKQLRRLYELGQIQEGTPVGTISQLQALQLTMWWRDLDSQEWLISHGYGQEWQIEAEAWLEPEARKIRAWLMEGYAKQYHRINPVFRRLRGVNLARVANYGGFRAVENSNEDPNLEPGAATKGFGVASGFSRTRRMTPLGPPKPIDALTNYWNNAYTVEHYIAWAETLTEMRAVLGHRDFRLAVETNRGQEKARQLMQWIDTLEKDGQRDAVMNTIWGNLMTRLGKAVSSGALLFKLSVVFKQVAAAIQSSFKIGAVSYAKGLGRVLGRKGVISLADMWRSNTIQRRLNSYEPEMRAAMESYRKRGLENEWLDLITQEPNRILDFGWNVLGMADAVFTTLSATIAYDHAYREGRKLGLSEEEAKAYAVQETDIIVAETAQPQTTETKSLFENTTNGALLRLIFAFMSANRQLFGLTYIALKKGKKMEGAEAWAIAAVIAAMSQTVGNFFRLLMSDDEPEEVFELKDYMAAMATAPMTGALHLGYVLEAALPFFGIEPRTSVNPAYTAGKSLKELFEGKADERDIGNLMSGVGMLLGGRFAGLGVGWNVIRQLLGLAERLED